MAKRTLETDIKFHHWMIETWGRLGGLITPATAARMLSLTKGRVTQMMTEGKLQRFVFPEDNLVFVSWLEVRNMAEPLIRAKQKRLAHAEIKKSGLPPEKQAELKKIADAAIDEASFPTGKKSS